MYRLQIKSAWVIRDEVRPEGVGQVDIHALTL